MLWEILEVQVTPFVCIGREFPAIVYLIEDLEVSGVLDDGLRQSPC